MWVLVGFHAESQKPCPAVSQLVRNLSTSAPPPPLNLSHNRNNSASSVWSRHLVHCRACSEEAAAFRLINDVWLYTTGTQTLKLVNICARNVAEARDVVEISQFGKKLSVNGR